MDPSISACHLRVLLGGTFDPIHEGHLTMARWVQTTWPQCIMHFIPCHQPGHRNQPVASGYHRLQMIKLAIAGDPHMIADTIELDNSRTSYSLYTLKMMQSLYPDDHLAWLMGYDSWLNLHTWYGYPQLKELAHMIIIQRDQYQTTNPPQNDMKPAQNPDVLYQQAAGCYYILPNVAPNISSTQIRHTLQQGIQPSTQQLPKPVYQYIKQHHLYSNLK